MKSTKISLLFAGLFFACQAWAVPVLQVGAPGGAGEGTYADYQGSTSNPTEKNTAITSGSSLYVAGVYQNNKVRTLGGESTGLDWGGVNSAYAAFNTYGAILLAAVPDGYLAMAVPPALTVNGLGPIYSSATLSGLFPNNHDPLKDGVSDFLFFDIGDFAKISNAVPDFSSETGAADGEIKTLTLAGAALTDLAWIHFDVLALETSSQGRKKIVTTIENNPGSKDVTWKKPGIVVQPEEIPEPGVLFLMGAGLLGLGMARRRKPA